MSNFSILPKGDPARRKPERVVPGFEPAAIDHVIDSCTIAVSIKGVRHDVRLIGAQSPQAFEGRDDQHFQEGLVARKYAERLAPLGSRVWLQTDDAISATGTTLPRYLWLEIPADPDSYDFDEAKEKLLNANVLAAGHARLDASDSAAKLAPILAAAAEEATTTTAGVSYLWA